MHSGTTDKTAKLVKDAELTQSYVKKYFDKYGLMVNASKTQIIFIGSRQNIAKIPKAIKIQFNNKVISPSLYVKNLGVYFDRFMTLEHHIDKTDKKQWEL